MFQAGQTRRKLLGKEVVVETSANQFRCNGRGERRGVQMGKSTGMGRLIRPVHHLLKITEEGFNAGPLRLGSYIRQRAHQGHRAGSFSGADPPAEKI